MTLQKAAPNDWAKWFAAVTGMPLEYVREKLGMEAGTDMLGERKAAPVSVGTTHRGLTAMTVRSR